MSIYAIADLHLSFNKDKPMDIFGENWYQHEEKIKKDWINNVNQDDLVILPGDFSWATYLDDTYSDFKYINDLPGKKLLLKGNHDYWWSTLTSMRSFIKENNFLNIEFLYNNSYMYKNVIIAGTRGWNVNEKNNEKMINRELIRLELSLNDGINKYGAEKNIIVCMHYPPIVKGDCYNSRKFIDIMKKYNVKKCVYGHLHSQAHNEAIEGMVEGIEFELVSADYLNFKIKKIL